MEDIIGGKIFEQIQIDERVNTSLRHCLFCKIVSTKAVNDSRILLETLKQDSIKKCPFSQSIYILNNFLLENDSDIPF